MTACPTCGARNLRTTYFVAAWSEGVVKIGDTINLAKRLTDLRCAVTVPLSLIGSTTDVSERALHRRFASERLPWNDNEHPPWMTRPRVTGPREWFWLTPRLYDEIIEVCEQWEATR